MMLPSNFMNMNTRSALQPLRTRSFRPGRASGGIETDARREDSKARRVGTSSSSTRENERRQRKRRTRCSCVKTARPLERFRVSRPESRRIRRRVHTETIEPRRAPSPRRYNSIGEERTAGKYLGRDQSDRNIGRNGRFRMFRTSRRLDPARRTGGGGDRDTETIEPSNLYSFIQGSF